MKERPIIFSGDMVKAILDGRKTQTRRVIKPQSTCARYTQIHHPKQAEQYSKVDNWILCPDGEWAEIGSPYGLSLCPYGQPGDRLWVRETYGLSHAWDSWPAGAIPEGNTCDAKVYYAATEDLGGLILRPSIFMPRWASRITLEVTGVRVEQVQDISESDAEAEGAHGYTNAASPIDFFICLWNKLNAKRGYGWSLNSFVWVIEFKQVKED